MSHLIDPNTMQIVEDDADSLAKQAEELELAISDANASGFVPASPDPSPAPPAQAASVEPDPSQSAAPTVEPHREQIPNWGPQDWAEQSRAFREGTFGQPPKPAPETKVPDKFDALQAKIDQLADILLKAQQASQPQRPDFYSSSLDPEFAELNPEAASRLELVSKQAAERIRAIEERTNRTLSDLEARDRERQKMIENERAQAYVTNWDATLRRLVPDLQNYLPGAPGHQALSKWASESAPEYVGALANPYAVSPHFIAGMINQFRPMTPRKSLADVANPVLMGTAPAVVQQQEPSGPLLSEQQFTNAENILSGLYSQGKVKEAEIFEKAYERTVLSFNKPR